MLRKYNIALLPTTKSATIIKYAQLFSEISAQYQLGAQSLPHVTLCKFKAKRDEVDVIWTETCLALQTHSLQLIFKNINCVTFDNKIFWISLLPNQHDILNEMHQTVAKVINLAVKKYYDPHMTLINTINDGYGIIVDKLSKIYSPILDDFVLSIGESDAFGQFTKLIYQWALLR